MKYESRLLFHKLRAATVESGLSYRGLLPRLAERYHRKLRTIYAWSVGALPVPPAAWDDLVEIMAVLGVEVPCRVPDNSQHPVESPKAFVKRIRKENKNERRERQLDRRAAARAAKRTDRP